MNPTVMGRPEEERMHALARSLAPDAIELFEEYIAKPKSIAVAVERHNVDWRSGAEKTQERFLWMQARRKITVQKIKDSYFSNITHDDVQITFRVDGQIPDGNATLADLDTHNDKFVVFTTQTPVATTPAFVASSPLFGLGASQSLDTPTPQIPTLDTNLGAGRASSFVFPPCGPSKARDELFNLPPTTTDTPGFMESNDQQDTSVTFTNDDLDFSLMQQQDPRVIHSTPFNLKIRQSPGSQTQQFDQPDHKSLGTPEKATASHSPTSNYKPRPIPNIFGMNELVGRDKPSSQTSLQFLLQDCSPERLEAAVKKGLTVLSSIEEPLSALRRDSDAQNWLEQIEILRRSSATKHRTVIGVVGNTGAGKSSIINAILDEERLVPTNCMRACTAVVTEISYNDSHVASSLYRAEIEFIQPEDWRRELTVLFQEVFDKTGGISKEATNPDTDAGVAYAKIRAVYHKYTKAMLQQSTIEQLMDDPTIKPILGTVKRINSSDCASFYQRLQHYVDSQQKSSGDGDKSKRSKRGLQWWPLIKVVRIYTKADALSTGAVIVDLPGVHDSNAARAAVAENYIKECTGLWIVAPISRAVDDKAAKNLLGTTFKRQLKYDGAYSAVTFICSKTDDISRTEATDSLQLGAVMKQLETERDEIDQERRNATDEQRFKQAEKVEQDGLIEEYDDEIERLEEFLDDFDVHQHSDAPGSPTKKRKRFDENRAGTTSDHDSSAVQQAHSRINELTKMRKSARKHNKDLADGIKALQRQLSDLSARRIKNNEDSEALCINGRNEWSRKRIRDDFAEGIKELDQENAAEQDPENFDPGEDMRDYGQVASSLPVFCVSSRAYQRLSGRLQKDSDVNGFAQREQTEIPQLQAHCRKLTEGGRQASCKSFLNGLSQLLTSLSLWALDDGDGVAFNVDQREMARIFLDINLQKLQKALKEAVNNTMDDVEEMLNSQLLDHLASATDAATSKALATSSAWGAPQHQGGLFWATYKATVRRDGVFQGSSGSSNFNTDLTDPLYQGLANAWDLTFHRRLPQILIRFPNVTNTTIKHFHTAVEEKCKQLGLAMFRVNHLRENIPVLETSFNEVASMTISNLNEGQREINREFNPSIRDAMSPVYKKCGDESGRGSFDRMKNYMHDHISSEGPDMFENAARKTTQNLTTMFAQTRTTLHGRVDRMFNTIARDYHAIVGTDASKDLEMGSPERLARKAVEDAISASEGVFSKVLDSDLEQTKMEESPDNHEGVADGDQEWDIEDATQPLASFSSDGADEDEDDEDDDEMADIPHWPR